MKILSKITSKSVCGSIDFKALMKWEEENPGKEIHLYDVFGIVNSMRADKSEHGEYVRFSGQFKAINAATGEVLVSGSMLLPKIAESLIAGAMQEGASLEFGLRIGVVYDEESATKYVYTVRSLLEIKANDPLSAIEARVHQEAPKALAAPTQHGAPLHSVVSDLEPREVTSAAPAPAAKSKKAA